MHHFRLLLRACFRTEHLRPSLIALLLDLIAGDQRVAMARPRSSDASCRVTFAISLRPPSCYDSARTCRFRSSFPFRTTEPTAHILRTCFPHAPKHPLPAAARPSPAPYLPTCLPRKYTERFVRAIGSGYKFERACGREQRAKLKLLMASYLAGIMADASQADEADTKLSITRFRPACSNSISSLLPSISTISP